MISVPCYNQWDARWLDKTIGDTGHTMGSWGCFVTSIAMMVNNYAIFKNPGEVLDDLNAVGAFTEDGLVTYDGVERAYPALHFIERVYTTNDHFAAGYQKMQVDIAIANVEWRVRCGLPTVLCVDNLYNDGNPDHACLCPEVGEGVGDWIIQDPDGGVRIPFKQKYGDPQTKLYGYVSILGPAIGFPDLYPNMNDGKVAWKLRQFMARNDIYKLALPHYLNEAVADLLNP